MITMTMTLAKAMSMEIGRAAVRGLRGDPLRDPEILSQTRDAVRAILSETRGKDRRGEMPTFPLTVPHHHHRWHKHPEEL